MVQAALTEFKELLQLLLDSNSCMRLVGLFSLIEVLIGDSQDNPNFPMGLTLPRNPIVCIPLTISLI